MKLPKPRRVIVHIGTSADGYIARPDGDLEWLTSRPAPKGFYGMEAFMKSIDTKVLGRKTYEVSRSMGAKFDSGSRTLVFSRQPRPADAPAGVEWVNGGIGPLVSRLREQPGKDIWLMGGGGLFRSLLAANLVDSIETAVVPVLLGDGVPLLPGPFSRFNLNLVSSKVLDSGLLMLVYQQADAPAKPARSKRSKA